MSLKARNKALTLPSGECIIISAKLKSKGCNTMKKTIIFISALVFAVVALCSCGGKSSSSGSAHSQKVNTAADGKWQCTDIPESMKLEKITLEIKDGNFTYTTADSKTTAM